MSKNKAQQEAPQKEPRVMTKYDRKMQAYQEQERKERARKQRANVFGVAIVLAVAALVLSFPIRNYLAVNGTYIIVGGEKVNKVEFDYNYAMARTNFIAQNGYYLSMMGMNTSNIDSQMYSTDLTFRDYFEQLAVANIQNTKALKAEAQAAGFSYDTDSEYQQLIAELKDGAGETGTSLNKYLKSMFGGYATESRLERVLREGILTNAYYDQVADASAPSGAEIDSYYDEHKENYDVVDYHLTIVEAELPTAAPDGSPTLDEEGNEVAYQPTEEETAAAMEEAKKKADSAAATILVGGESKEAQSRSAVSYLLSEWLFDEARAKGDTTVVEDTTNHRYLVAGFDQRYRVETPTADIRAIVTRSAEGSEVNAQSILEEWKNGAATEDSFIELCGKYDENGVKEGLYEGVATDSMSDEMNAWLADPARRKGDTAAFTEPDGSDYVIYYLGINDPVWKLSIHDLLLSQAMTEYLEGISQAMTLEDPKGNLNYLKVEAAASEAAARESESGENQEDTPENQGDTPESQPVSSGEESAESSSEDVG